MLLLVEVVALLQASSAAREASMKLLEAFRSSEAKQERATRHEEESGFFGLTAVEPRLLRGMWLSGRLVEVSLDRWKFGEGGGIVGRSGGCSVVRWGSLMFLVEMSSLVFVVDRGRCWVS